MKWVILFLGSLILLAGCMPMVDCSDNLNCFKEHVKDCSRAKVNINHEGNILRLTLRGMDDNDCKVSLKIESVADDIREEYPLEASIAKGKTINCDIPMNINYYIGVDDVKAVMIEKCSGPIKDLMEGPLQKMVEEELETLFLIFT